MDLSIIIINWNARDLLEKCLDSIFHGSQSIDFEVIVADNASSDGSADLLGQRFPQVRVIENDVNVGFARANNQAIHQSRGRYILLLNPDTDVKPGALEILLDFIENHPRAGAVGPRLLNIDGTLQFSCSPTPTLSRELLRLFHLPGVRPDGYYPMHRWDTITPRKVDVLIGACMLLRSETLALVGFLDEDYFMYSEEVDLCYRIKQAGWQLYWVPKAEVEHYGGQSTQQVPEQMFLNLYQAKLIYFRKHGGKVKADAYKLALITATLLRLAITPLAWLEQPTQRRRHIALAGNYRRLLSELTGI